MVRLDSLTGEAIILSVPASIDTSFLSVICKSRVMDSLTYTASKVTVNELLVGCRELAADI